jgi:hypothetical protein
MLVERSACGLEMNIRRDISEAAKKDPPATTRYAAVALALLLPSAPANVGAYTKRPRIVWPLMKAFRASVRAMIVSRGSRETTARIASRSVPLSE